MHIVDHISYPVNSLSNPEVSFHLRDFINPSSQLRTRQGSQKEMTQSLSSEVPGWLDRVCRPQKLHQDANSPERLGGKGASRAMPLSSTKNRVSCYRHIQVGFLEKQGL